MLLTSLLINIRSRQVSILVILYLAGKTKQLVLIRTLMATPNGDLVAAIPPFDV